MKIRLITLLFGLPVLLFAQEIERDVVANAGKFTANGISMDFTIGESATSYKLEMDFHYTEGFQQGEYRPIIVPVELLSFEGERLNDKKAKLTWETASETNNKGFYIERRNEDGEEFREVGFVEGQGNSSGIQKYVFLDDNMETQNTYYRLRQVDFDESFVYSEIKIVPPIKVKSVADLAPNPVRNEILVNIQSNVNSDGVKITIYNLHGAKVKSLSYSNIAAGEDFKISLDEEIPQGTYILQISYGSEILEPIQFIKL